MNSSQFALECVATLHYAPFQIGLVVHSAVVVVSFYATFYFLEKHIQNSPIHRNFKFLLLIHFARSGVHGIVFLLTAVSFFTRVFTFEGRIEDSFMNSTFYKCLHLIYAVVLVADVSVKILLVLERALATCRVDYYEADNSSKSCWSFAIFSVVFPCVVIHVAYQNANFEEPVCFALFSPKGTEFQVNMLFLSSTVLALTAFIVLRVLIVVNKRKLKVHHSGLSTRYQISENLECTHLVSTVLITGLSVTITHAFSMTVLRLGQFHVLVSNPPLFSTFKLLVYPLTMADLAIPIYSTCQMKRTKTTKTWNLSQAIHTSSQETTASYEKQLKAQWA